VILLPCIKVFFAQIGLSAAEFWLKNNFNMASVRHIGFSKLFLISGRLTVVIFNFFCILLPNFTKIGWLFFTEIRGYKTTQQTAIADSEHAYYRKSFARAPHQVWWRSSENTVFSRERSVKRQKAGLPGMRSDEVRFVS